MGCDRLIVGAPDYLADRVRALTQGGEFLRSASLRYRFIEAIVNGTRTFVAELFPGKMPQCSDEELASILSAAKKQGLTVLDNPQLVE